MPLQYLSPFRGTSVPKIGMQYDSYFWYDVLAMPFNGTVGAAVYDDLKGHTFTALGTVPTLASGGRDGTTALSLADTGGLLCSTDPGAWQFTSDFTIEFWIYPTNLNGTTGKTILSQWAYQNAAACNFQLSMRTDRVSFNYYYSGSPSASSFVAMGSVSNNAWNHIAVCRSGSALMIYLNGSLIGSKSESNPLQYSSRPLAINGIHMGGTTYSYRISCLLDNLRMTNGFCRYTSNFVPK